MRILVLVTLLFASVTAAAQTPETVRVCTYNLLQFGEDDSDRIDEFVMILNEVRPHILLAQEIMTDAAYSFFRDSIAPRLDIPLMGAWWANLRDDSHTVMFYDSSVVWLLNPAREGGGMTRALTMYTLRVRATGDTVVAITGHLKAGTDAEDHQQRAREAGTLRHYVIEEMVRRPKAFLTGSDSLFFFAGDLNIYSASDSAYRVLTDLSSEPATALYDPIRRPGDWNNNEDFADIHTQSTRARQFGGGVHGGLDDRFDQILVSKNLLAMVDTASYTAFGNDGRHFNDSVNAPTNTAVSAEMAQALHDASDHLPVFVDLVFGRTTSVESEERTRARFLDLSESESHAGDPVAHRRGSAEPPAGR